MYICVCTLGLNGLSQGWKGCTIEAERASEQKLPKEMKYVVQDNNTFGDQSEQERKEEKKERKVRLKWWR